MLIDKKKIALLSALVTFPLICLALYVSFIEPNWIWIEKRDIKNKKLAQIFKGLKVLHLSDFEIARYGYREKRLIEKLREQKPDIIFITGDLTEKYDTDYSPCIKTLEQLEARMGIFVVLGNSDHTLGSEFSSFLKSLKRLNIKLLVNESYRLEINNKTAYIVGVDDPFYLFDSFEEAISDVPPGFPAILLAHSPDIILPRADAMVINLQDFIKAEKIKGWGWQDATNFGPDNGDVYFASEGIKRIRIQSRQDGVSIDTMVLNPYKEIDSIIASNNSQMIERLLFDKDLSKKYPHLILIKVAGVKESQIHGSWRKEKDPECLFNFSISDLPDNGMWYFQPLIDPHNYFEAKFRALKKRYHVWMRLKSNHDSPLSDSIYIQFDDSYDNTGKTRYRIGKPVYSLKRLRDIDLILAGHTHGGQIRLPFYGAFETMTTLGKKYDYGVFDLGNQKVHISRGVGTSTGHWPIRLFCPPEIAILNFS